MQSSYPEQFDREMTCTEAEWLRWLPQAIGAHVWTMGGDAADVRIADGALAVVALGLWLATRRSRTPAVVKSTA